MRSIFRCLKAEYLKYKHSTLLYMHLLLPVLGAVTFAGYYHMSNWQVSAKVGAYLEILAAAFPFLIGIITGITVHTENQAGNFQLMLGTIPSRAASCMGKIGFLYIHAFEAVLLALAIFCILYREAPFLLYLKAGCLLTLTALPIYLIHLFVGMNYGKGASMGLGIAGSLTAALMITGLGDAVWNYVPWAWGVRSMDYIVLAWSHPELYALMKPDFFRGMSISILCTCILLAAYILWFRLWDGGKNNE